jgi:NAD+ synthase
VIIPEKDSSSESELLAREVGEKFGVKVIREYITPALTGFKCYERRDEAVRKVFPEYDPEHYRMKISIRQSGLYTSLPPLFSLTIVDSNGQQKEKLLPVDEYLKIVAASNFKQRSRMSILYYHAESLYYAVVGTPNKHEQEQGFFVKYGDGAADVMPIGNLYKTQVYQIASYLGIPDAIMLRTPTTDTYSAEQTQEEFFYQLPFRAMDLYWYGFENGYSPREVGEVMGETEERVTALFRNFQRKRKTTEYLRIDPFVQAVAALGVAGGADDGVADRGAFLIGLGCHGAVEQGVGIGVVLRELPHPRVSEVGRELPAVVLHVHRPDEAPLLQVGSAHHMLGLLAYLLQSRHQNRHQQSDNRDHDEQFNEREGPAIGR